MNRLSDIKGKKINLTITTPLHVTIHTLLYFPSVFYMHILQSSYAYKYAIYGFESYFLIL